MSKLASTSWGANTTTGLGTLSGKVAKSNYASNNGNYILSNIHPPDICRSSALILERRNVMSNENLPIHQYIFCLNEWPQRLKSRQPPLGTVKNIESNCKATVRWCEIWRPTTEHIRIIEPTTGIAKENSRFYRGSFDDLT